MQTILDASGTEAEWLVKLTAGLPGGIGNTGAECGGVTSPLLLIGLRHARDPMHHGLPPFIDKGHDLLQRFAGRHGTTLCREIRGTDRLPLRCVGAVRHAPELCAQTLSSDCAHVIPAASRDAYRRLYAQFVEKEFHCAHAVVQRPQSAVLRWTRYDRHHELDIRYTRRCGIRVSAGASFYQALLSSHFSKCLPGQNDRPRPAARTQKLSIDQETPIA